MRLIALVLLLVSTLLVACRAANNEAKPVHSPAATIPPSTSASSPSITAPSPSTTAPSPIVAETINSPVAIATQTPLQQYRTWMEEARSVHPYPESVDRMWAVMLCESSGDPNTVHDSYYGLFQYQPDTWAGDWNTYRNQPILDPHAQIFATAKAWQDGYQGWWGCY